MTGPVPLAVQAGFAAGHAPCVQPATLSRAHDQRLRAMYRSAGWPCQDTIEIELLAAGLLERVMPALGPEFLRVTDDGIQRLAGALNRNRAALDAHEALVNRVAEEQVRNGRVAFCNLTLLAKPQDSWLHMRPDVYSIRNTTVEHYVEPVVYEIKVKRSDLKADLKKPDKRAGYLALSAECYYVIAEGIAQPDEIPAECGVIIAHADRLERVRTAPARATTLSFSHWMALAKADRFRMIGEPNPAL